MSDFIGDLFSRSLGREDLILPRIPSSYEGWQAEAPEAEAEGVEFSAPVERQRRRPPPPDTSLIDPAPPHSTPDGALPEYSPPDAEPPFDVPAQDLLSQRQDVQPPPELQEPPAAEGVRESVLRIKSGIPADRISPPEEVPPRDREPVPAAEKKSTPSPPESIQPLLERAEASEAHLPPTTTPSRVVKVSIGRIEVRIPQPPPQPQAEFVQAPRRSKYRPPVSLSEYMNKRGR